MQDWAGADLDPFACDEIFPDARGLADVGALSFTFVKRRRRIGPLAIEKQLVNDVRAREDRLGEAEVHAQEFSQARRAVDLCCGLIRSQWGSEDVEGERTAVAGFLVRGSIIPGRTPPSPALMVQRSPARPLM